MPLAIFVMAGTCSVVLMVQRSGIPQAVGIANSVTFNATSPGEGLLLAAPSTVAMERFQTVVAGDLLARLDDAPIQLELKRLQAQQRAMEYELAATAAVVLVDEANLHVDASVEIRRRQVRVEELRLELLESRTQLEIPGHGESIPP